MWRWLGLRLFTLIILIGYIYSTLLILNMALFNLILLGIIVVYLTRLWTALTALELRVELSYRTDGFLRYIESENLRYYRLQKAELVGGEMGRWVELQLPEDVDELKKETQMSERLERDARLGRARFDTVKTIND